MTNPIADRIAEFLRTGGPVAVISQKRWFALLDAERERDQLLDMVTRARLELKHLREELRGLKRKRPSISV